MSERGGDGVLEVVDTVASVFATIAIIDPGVRVLMHEQRHTDGREIAVAFVAITIAPERVPGRRRNRIRGRGDREHVKNGVFAVSVPPRLQKT